MKAKGRVLKVAKELSSKIDFSRYHSKLAKSLTAQRGDVTARRRARRDVEQHASDSLRRCSAAV